LKEDGQHHHELTVNPEVDGCDSSSEKP